MVKGKFLSLNARGSENKNPMLFSFRKHILPMGMKFLGEKNGVLLFFAPMELIMQY